MPLSLASTGFADQRHGQADYRVATYKVATVNSVALMLIHTAAPGASSRQRELARHRLQMTTYFLS